MLINRYVQTFYGSTDRQTDITYYFPLVKHTYYWYVYFQFHIICKCKSCHQYATNVNAYKKVGYSSLSLCVDKSVYNSFTPSLATLLLEKIHQEKLGSSSTYRKSNIFDSIWQWKDVIFGWSNKLYSLC